jgi:autotransporter-associated beta strand protein
MNVGTATSRYGEIRIGNTTASNGTFNVSGGTVTVGTGAAGNKIYFFKNGSSAGYTASMTQSAGTVTTNGIQFGSATGTYDAGSAANLTLSGGSLYIGDRGIILGSGVETLPVTIKLQGGTLGADQDWSSSMGMKLGATAGGPTIQAQNGASTARNIALSGILSDDGDVNGTLTKTGTGTLTLSSANSYTGLTTVTAGSLSITSTGSLASGNALTLGADGTADLANASQNLGAVSNSNTATNALNFSNADGTVVLASLTGAGKTRFGSNGTVTDGISSGTVTSVSALNANISGGTITAGGLLTGTISGAGTVGADSLSSTSVTGGTNTITGAAGITTLNGGTTTVGGIATIDTLASGTANLNGATSSITTLNGGTVNLGNSTLSVDAGTTSGSIAGASGALTVTGALALNGTNSYGGVTTVSAGADLRINGTNSGAGAVNIAATGKLGGSGSVISGINVSGILAPGNSIESLGGGDLNFATGSTYAYELQTDLFDGTANLAADLTYSSGTLNIASGTILTLTDLGASTALAGGSKLTLISSTGAWNSGLFSYDAGAGLASLADDSDITLGANIWRLNYNDTLAGSNFSSDTAGATNYVTLTVVPEPSVATLVGGLGMIALLRRRRN